MLELIEIDSTLRNKITHFVGKDLVFFDLETTGLSPAYHFIIEIGAIKIKTNGTFESFKTLVKPPMTIPQRSIDIHGIQNQDVENAPCIEEVLPKFFEFIKDSDLVAHNAMFDLGFIIKESKRFEFKLPIVNVYDSLKITRNLLSKLDPSPENFKLTTLASYINFNYQSHRAYDDSLATLHIWANCLEKTLDDDLIKEAHQKCLVYSTKKIKAHNEKSEKYQLLAKLSSEQKMTVISYNGGKRRGQERSIKPIALIPLPNNVSLYAHCLRDDTFKTFSLHKIEYARPFTPQEESDFLTSQLSRSPQLSQQKEQ